MLRRKPGQITRQILLWEELGAWRAAGVSRRTRSGAESNDADGSEWLRSQIVLQHQTRGKQDRSVHVCDRVCGLGARSDAACLEVIGGAVVRNAQALRTRTATGGAVWPVRWNVLVVRAGVLGSVVPVGRDEIAERVETQTYGKQHEDASEM